MIDTEALRKKVIDLAMQGKLTQQLPEDGNAEDLYAKAQEEKAKLIKAGKIKTEKLLPVISNDEVPFDIPDNWKWVYCRDVMLFINGRAYKKEELLSNGRYPVLRVGNFFSNEQYYYSDLELDEDKYCKNGDLLYAWSASFGPKIWCGEKVIFHYHIWKIKMLYPLNTKYIYYYLLADTNRIKDLSHGIGFVFVTKEFMERRLMPIPPLEEQERIVERIEEACAQIDIIDALQQLYESDREILKGKIIDAGIRGKLTEQLPEDGDAEDLYAQIQEEKTKLIKEGKIKKEKPSPEISDEEVPFEIPDNWKWVRFSDLYSLSNGVASRGSEGGKPHPVLRLADLTSGEIDIENVRCIDLIDSEFNSHKIHKGDLVFIRVNGSRDKVANAFLYSGEEEISYCDHLFCGHKISDLFEPEYVMLVYHSSMVKKQIDPEIKTTAGQNTINQKSMSKIIIPLPPTAEQRRIVDKVKMILSSMPE